MAPKVQRKQHLLCKNCRFSNCNNNSVDNPTLKFFKFNLSNVFEWRKACNNDKLANLSVHTLCRLNYYVCSSHFKNEDYRMVLSPYKSKLKIGAIPRNIVPESEG